MATHRVCLIRVRVRVRIRVWLRVRVRVRGFVLPQPRTSPCFTPSPRYALLAAVLPAALYLPYISPTSPLHLPYISLISVYLPIPPYISQVRTARSRAARGAPSRPNP